MTLLEERDFQHNDRKFLLKLFRTDLGFSVTAFLNGQQVSPSYSVSFETHTDYFMQHQDSVVENLFGFARSDLEQGMYFHT